MTNSRTILYIAASEAAARDGATALERAVSVGKGTIRATVEPLATTDIEAVRDRVRAPVVDCVVFAETPTTAAGAHLLEVSDACGDTPLVLFTDAAYGPTAARSTEGVDGYVRRGDERAGADVSASTNTSAFEHLLDEIVWLADGDEGATGSDAPSALPAAENPTDGLLESLPDGVFTVDREARIAYANDWMGELLAIDAERVRGVPLSALATAGTVSTDDVDALEAAVDRVLEGSTPEPIGLPIEVTADGRRREVTLRISARGDEAIVTVRPALDDRSGEGDGNGDGDGASEDNGTWTTNGERSPPLEWLAEPAVRYAVADGEVIVRAVNTAFADVFGVDREAVTGVELAELGLDAPVERVREAVESVHDDGRDEDEAGAEIEDEDEERATDDSLEFTSRHRTATGVGEFAVTVEPDPRADRRECASDGEDGEAGGIVRFTDVTERRRREYERAVRTDRLEGVAELTGDLRTPLNLARGYLELAAETGDREHVAEVEAAHARIDTLVERIRTLARRDDAVGTTEPVAIHDSARRAWAAVDIVPPADAHLQLERDGILEADRRQLLDFLEIVFQYVREGESRVRDPGAKSETGAGTGASAERTERDGSVENDGSDENAARPRPVRIGATEDGFFVAHDGRDLADRESGSGRATAVDGGAIDATRAGEGFGLHLVERFVDAHGWSISITETETDGLRIDVADAAVTGLESARGGETAPETETETEIESEPETGGREGAGTTDASVEIDVGADGTGERDED